MSVVLTVFNLSPSSSQDVEQGISDIPQFPGSVLIEYNGAVNVNVKGIQCLGEQVTYGISKSTVRKYITQEDYDLWNSLEQDGIPVDYTKIELRKISSFYTFLEEWGWRNLLEAYKSGFDETTGAWEKMLHSKDNFLAAITIKENVAGGETITISILKYDVSEAATVIPEREAQIKKRVREYADAMDKGNKITIGFANHLATKFPGSFSIKQILSIYDYLYNNWKYVNDPSGIDYVKHASETIQNFKDYGKLMGDCDDYAVLMATLIEAIGGEARIVLAIKSPAGHAYAEVQFYDSPNTVISEINNHYAGLLEKFLGMNRVDKIYYRKDPDGSLWLNLDWRSKYPGGDYYNSLTDWSYDWTLVYSDGRYTAVKQSGYYEGRANE